MAPVSAFVGSVLAVSYSMLKDFYQWVRPHCEYVANLDQNYEELKEEHKSLVDLKRDVEERNQDTTMSNYCRNLLNKTGNIEENVRELVSHYEGTKTSLCGMWPFCKLHELGKGFVEARVEVTKTKDELEKLINDGAAIVKKRLGKYEPKHAIIELKLQNKNVEELMRLLRDESLIGIYGLSGVGKTTTLKKLKITIEKQGVFDKVILVSVDEYDMKELKHHLVEQLKLPMKTMDTGKQRDAISNESKESKFLVLLDQVSSPINLEALGIRDAKVVLACEQRHFFKGMDASVFQLGTLPEEDAQTLFDKIVGDVILDPNIQDIAVLVLRQLGGHPQLIKIVATALKNQNSERVWHKMRTDLMSPIDFLQKDFQDVINALYHAVDNLPYNTKRCLVFTSLFPMDHLIYQDYLVDCWRIAKLTSDDVQARENNNVHYFSEAWDYGQSTLDELIDRSLIERCSRVSYLRMSILIRKMAKEILSPSVEGGKPVVAADFTYRKRELTAKEWKARRISLMCHKLQSNSLPKKPDCPNVTTLLLQENSDLFNIPEKFFDRMSNLHLLDLYHTGIKSLPPSLFSLKKLRGLFLNHCDGLVELSSKIGKLKSLEVLDIRGTGIQSLPVEIGELNNLRCLRVSFPPTEGNDQINPESSSSRGFMGTRQPRVMIPPNVIRKLHQLEELAINVNPGNQSWNKIIDNISKEVSSLRALSRLRFYFPTIESLRTFTSSSHSWNNKETPWGENNSFRSYELVIGHHKVIHPHEPHSLVNSDKRLLRFCSAGEIPPEIKEVLKRANSFELSGHSSVQCFSDFGKENMNSLKSCVINECSEISSIIAGSRHDRCVLPVLENLQLINLDKLSCIWSGPVGCQSLLNLKFLTLFGCPILTKIFSFEIIQQLKHLQRLRVENCPQLVDIIEPEICSLECASVGSEIPSQVTEIIEICSQDTDISSNNHYSMASEIFEDENIDLRALLPHLKMVELINLPNLVSICRTSALGWAGLEKIEIKRCSKLRNLSLSATNAKILKVISCHKHWFSQMLDSQADCVRDRLTSICRQFDEESVQSDQVQEVNNNNETFGDQTGFNSSGLGPPNASSSSLESAGPPSDPSSSVPPGLPRNDPSSSAPPGTAFDEESVQSDQVQEVNNNNETLGDQTGLNSSGLIASGPPNVSSSSSEPAGLPSDPSSSVPPGLPCNDPSSSATPGTASSFGAVLSWALYPWKRITSASRPHHSSRARAPIVRNMEA